MPEPMLETVVTAATCTNLTRVTDPKIPSNPNCAQAETLCYHLQVVADALHAQQLLKTRLVLVAKTIRCECLLAEVAERFISNPPFVARTHSTSYTKQKRIIFLTQIRIKFYVSLVVNIPALTTTITLGGSPGVDGPRCRGSVQS